VRGRRAGQRHRHRASLLSENTARRVAVVTGGSSGIGLATGRALVGRGYDVVLTARREGPLREAAESVGARWVAGDSGDPNAFAAVVEAAGKVDLLVHAAGIMKGTFVRKDTVETFDEVLAANLRSAFVVSSACLPVMDPGGRMIFVSSSSAHRPQPGKSAYSASKAGLNAFAEALAREVERDGVAVHVVTTGPVATPMLDDVHFPMRTLAVDDVAGAIVWLDQLSPSVVLREIFVEAVEQGPFAPEAFVPEAARRLGRTEL
jgi:NAD(P)-dependent dehydrogenase (short-subunit alcohol dehydrogenase family)